MPQYVQSISGTNEVTYIIGLAISNIARISRNATSCFVNKYKSVLHLFSSVLAWALQPDTTWNRYKRMNDSKMDVYIWKRHGVRLQYKYNNMNKSSLSNVDMIHLTLLQSILGFFSSFFFCRFNKQTSAHPHLKD